MSRLQFPGLTVLLPILFVPTSAMGNDIVDFLRAISGSHPSHARESFPHNHSSAYHRAGYRNAHGHEHAALHGVSSNYRSRRFNEHIHERTTQPAWSFQVRIGNTSALPARTVALTPPPPPVSLHTPHQIGDIVTCPVEIETCVRIKDADEIAPGAVPIVVAVRDPHLGTYGSCHEQLAYVEVLAPPCPVRRVRVSPCKTKVRLDFGRYEVDLVSRNDVIEIDYDN